MDLTDADLLGGGLLIAGDPIRVATGGTMDHINPATGRVQSSFPVAGADEVDAAVRAARQALPTWRGLQTSEREAALRRLAALLRENATTFTRVTALENGTPVRMGQGQALSAARWFDYYAGWTDKVCSEVYPGGPGLISYSLHEPFGVVAVILTWNGPTGLIGMMGAAPLAAGCTIVLKAPELAPFSATLFGQLALEAGLPPGVVNVITGGPECGDRLVRHPDVDKVAFTGGPTTAQRIQAACAESLTPLCLELGGKSANIVLEGADIDAVSTSAVMGFTILSGQVCVAPTRLIVESSIHDELVERVVERVRALTMGDPLDPATVIGPMISESARQRAITMAEEARRAGGRLVVGGGVPEGDLGNGFYLQPAVVDDVDNSSDLAQNEVFGPLLAVVRADDATHAVDLANESRYGLAAYVHTNDLAVAHTAISRLQAGNVVVNGSVTAGAPQLPFGGFKDSGYGKEGGLEGLKEYLRVKQVTINAPAR